MTFNNQMISRSNSETFVIRSGWLHSISMAKRAMRKLCCRYEGLVWISGLVLQGLRGKGTVTETEAQRLCWIPRASTKGPIIPSRLPCQFPCWAPPVYYWDMGGKQWLKVIFMFISKTHDRTLPCFSSPCMSDPSPHNSALIFILQESVLLVWQGGNCGVLVSYVVSCLFVNSLSANDSIDKFLGLNSDANAKRS